MSAIGDHFRLMADYNARANKILYDAVSLLSDEEYRKQRPAFFGSIHGTLNHILLGDLIWVTRFEGGSFSSMNLGAEQHQRFAELRAAREAMDARIEAFMTFRLTTDFLTGSIAYVNNDGIECEDPVSVLLPHLFNHQTHHRGQVHDMLSQTEVVPPSLDLHRVILPI